MNSVVYLNGAKIGEWKYGYTRFSLELTGMLLEGENELMVSVTFQSPNSRWYSGAGINRNVWLMETKALCIPDGGVYTHVGKAADGGWELRVETEMLGTAEEISAEAELHLYDGDNEVSPSSAEEAEPLAAVQGHAACKVLHFAPEAGIRVWDLEDPKLYRLQVQLRAYDGALLQEENLRIGFRETAFDPEQGFLLNGRRVKINGACQHPD